MVSNFFIPSEYEMLVALSKNRGCCGMLGYQKILFKKINYNYSGVVPLCLLRQYICYLQKTVVLISSAGN
jgi:predicted house-cleaning NTP pyrophosphatase (Maf/HAM1 superfamily)